MKEWNTALTKILFIENNKNSKKVRNINEREDFYSLMRMEEIVKFYFEIPFWPYLLQTYPLKTNMTREEGEHFFWKSSFRVKG